MIGVPQPNPRDQLIDNLHQLLDQFFGSGKMVEQVAAGVSREREAMFGSSHASSLRAEHNKLAPQLKALAESGKTVSRRQPKWEWRRSAPA